MAKVGKAPTFDGTSSVEGFLRNFCDWRASVNLSDDDARVALRGALRDEAKRFEETVKYEGGATFERVCEELRAAFGGAAERYFNELSALKRGFGETLAEYNAKFSDLRAKAGKFLSSFMATRAYIQGLTPYQLQV